MVAVQVSEAWKEGNFDCEGVFSNNGGITAS